MNPPVMLSRSDVSGRCPFALAALSKPLNDMTSRLDFAFLYLNHAKREHPEKRHGLMRLFVAFCIHNYGLGFAILGDDQGRALF